MILPEDIDRGTTFLMKLIDAARDLGIWDPVFSPYIEAAIHYEASKFKDGVAAGTIVFEDGEFRDAPGSR